MTFIKISENEHLGLNAVESYQISTREVTSEKVEQLGHSGIGKVTRLPAKSETVLTITTMRGNSITLYGGEAEAALNTLRSGVS